MRVTLHNPKRELTVDGPLPVATMLQQLGLLRESVLVIRGDALVTGDAVLGDDDEIDIRPVISGGAR
jgi:sulfur carrier protein